MSKTGWIATLMLAVAIAGCDSDSDSDSGAAVAPAQLRVLHASPDAPAVNVLAGGAPVVKPDYGQASNLLEVNPAGFRCASTGCPPVHPPRDRPCRRGLTSGTLYSILTVGRVAGIERWVFAAVNARSHRRTNVRVVRRAGRAPVDVYLTALTPACCRTPVGTCPSSKASDLQR
jgi:hypothetical protein